ncbi:MAG: N-glycosylase/DNA lyase, partial [Desulfurococcales archaeon]|nr:N-glycosylase/DNA lyase [Desulfurococcales archaeon]
RNSHLCIHLEQGITMQRFIRNEGRIRRVAEAFKRHSKALDILESKDPQMRCAETLVSSCGVETAAQLMGMNALVSYMIPVRGEEFWTSFMEFAVKMCRNRGALEIVEEFTKQHNRFSLTAKLCRIKEFGKCVADNQPPYKDLGEYWKFLRTCLHAEGVEKTIAFSVKMVYYVLKSAGLNPQIPEWIPLPADRRAAAVTLTSGCVLPTPKDLNSLRSLAKDLFRKASLIREVWSSVGEMSGIPPLRLDVAVWLAGRYVGLWSREEALESMREELGLRAQGLRDVENLITELLYVLPE